MAVTSRHGKGGKGEAHFSNASSPDLTLMSLATHVRRFWTSWEICAWCACVRVTIESRNDGNRDAPLRLAC